MTSIDIFPFYEIIVKVRDNAICNDFCSKWIHVKCNDLNDLDYDDFKLRDEGWFCKAYILEILQFCSKKVDLNNFN